MARTAFASVRAMSDSASGTRPETTGPPAHPRCAAALPAGVHTTPGGIPDAREHTS